MIGLISGTIIEITDTTLLLETGGIGYLVHTPHPQEFKTQSQTTLWTHLAVRENSLDLYGFAYKQDKELFEHLLSIPKVGPKSALQILQKASPTLIWECVSSKDATRLSKTSGIGAKTAEKLVAELADLVPETISSTQLEADAETKQQATDIVEALVSLGYPEKDAYEVVIKIQKDEPEILLAQSQAITRALKYLS